MKKYIVDFSFGIVFALVFFLLTLFFEDIVYEYLYVLFPFFKNSLLNFILGFTILYFTLGIIPFFLYSLTSWYKKSHSFEGASFIRSYILFALAFPLTLSVWLIMALLGLDF